MRARSLYLLGDLAAARNHIDRMLDRYVPPTKRSHVARFQYDQRLVARITLARVLCLQGYADRALREIDATVAQADAIHHALTLAHVLSDGACPIALMVGDLDLAERYTAMLHEQTRTHSLDVWSSYADAFAGEILIRRGDHVAGLDRLRSAIETLGQAGFILYQTAFLASLAQGLKAAGQTHGALAAADQAIAQCDRTGEAWMLAELHRIRGEIQLGAPEVAAAGDGEASLKHALEIACGQRAVAWELRTATSLAQHWHRSGRSVDARALIASVLAKLAEGFATADYRAAATLLADLDGTVAA
jgi:predicted ATPase